MLNGCLRVTMSRYYQLIVFLTVYCIKNNCDHTEPSPGIQFKCVNDLCNEKIGLVEATQNYPLPDQVNKLKFNYGDKMDIYGVTTDGQFYLAKLGDRQGLITKKFVRASKQFHKEDDLISTHLDDFWRPIIRTVPSEEESVEHSSSSSSVDDEVSSNSADEVSVSIHDDDQSMNDKPLDMSHSPIEKLETSFQSSNDQKEPTSSLDFQNDQIKTSESPVVIQLEQITKSQPEQANFNIAPSSPSIASNPPSTTEVAGTTFPLDAFDDEEMILSDEVSLQSSTPTPIIDRPPPLFAFSGINNGIEPSDLSPSSIENPLEKSSEVNPSVGVEMSKVPENVEPANDQEKVPLPEDNQKVQKDLIKDSEKSLDSVVDSGTDKTSSESPSSDATFSTPSPIHPITDVDAASGETQSQTESSYGEIKQGTGLHDNLNNQPSETSTPPPTETEASPTTVTGSQNGFASNHIDGDKVNVDKIDVDASSESLSTPQVQNQDHSSSINASPNIKLDENLVRYQDDPANSPQSDQVEPNNHGSNINQAASDVDYQKYGTGSIRNQINDELSNHLPSSQPPVKQYSSPPSVANEKPLYNSNPYHNQQSEQQQQPPSPPTTGSSYGYQFNSQLHDPSDEMTRQVAAEVDSQQPPPPPSSYLSSEEPVTSDMPLSSSPQPPNEPESSLPSSENDNFDSKLALSTQSSLQSNSASPSDQQSTFNGASDSDPLTDSLTTFTETQKNYPDAMRSQIALLTTLLPEPMLDYLHHINFSPSIFIILLMITITWCVMFITSKIFSSHKDKVALEDQLCRNHGENFNLKTERDYLFDELAAEKEKNSRLLKEHLEMKDKFENINHHIEHSESVKSDLVIKLESLVNETRKQKQRIEQLEKTNETLKMESADAQNDLTKVKSDLDKLTEELAVKLDALETAEMELEKFAEMNDKLEADLASFRLKEIELQSDLKRLKECEETIDNLKTELEEKEQEIKSMKSFIEEYHNNTNGSPGYSVESLLDGIKLKAELNMAQNQLKSIKEEKDSLSSRMTELESRVSRAETESSEAVKARDEAERRLQILKTYFNEQEVKLQSELGTWKLKYEEILARNESIPGYIDDLKRSNESFKMQVENLEREIAKREEKHRVDCSKLERDKHELYMSKIRVVDDLKNLKSECEILRKKLTLKSQGYSDDDLKHSSGMDGPSSLHLESLPPPPPTGYLEDSLDSSAVGSGPWSLNALESAPPPFPVSWMNSGDSSTSGYSSLPPAPLPLQQPQSNHHYPSHHPHPHYPSIPPMRNDNYSPTSQRSHDQRSVRSDVSFSSTNNSHHLYSNYGPPPPLAPQTVQGPFSNPIPSHWSVNTQQQQQQQSHNESTNFNDSRNYYAGGR